MSIKKDKELTKKKPSARGRRKTHSDVPQDVAIPSTSRDSGLVVVVPSTSREDLTRLRYSGLKTEELKKLLKERNASTRGKKKDLLDRLVFYEMNSNFAVASTSSGPDLRDVFPLPLPDTYKDIHADSPVPDFTKNDVDLYLKRFQKDSTTGENMYAEGYLQYAKHTLLGVDVNQILITPKYKSYMFDDTMAHTYRDLQVAVDTA